VWERTCAHNKLRSLLREYYPAILAAFATKRGGLLRPEARALLTAAPTQRAATQLTTGQLRALLADTGRERGLDTEAQRLHSLLHAEYLHHPPLVEDAFGIQALALLRQLEAACANADQLAAAAVAHFEKHPDAEIITSLPGLGSLTGARVLAEIGDDRSRFANARSLKAYAGFRTGDPRQRQKPDRGAPPGQEPNALDLAWIAGSRWRIEECFQQAKNEAGLDHYQVRSWRAGMPTSPCPCSPWPGSSR
jgi:hypothetical protein